MQYIGYLLVIIHIVLLLWSVGGFLEMILPNVPWKPFTNPAFPDWVLVIHWGSVLFASVAFLFGYFSRWSKTPQVMALAYAFLSLVCIIETFGFMTSNTKYLALVAEFAAYLTILLLLFRSKYFMEYFKK